MAAQQVVIYEEDFQEVSEICQRLLRQANAKAVFLIDRNGQYITGHGEIAHLDTTSLASLTAGNVAAIIGMAKLIGEQEFAHIFHEGRQDSLHLSVVSDRAILVLMFDQRSSLGLVRLRVKKTSEELAQVFARMAVRAEKTGPETPLSEMSEDDIDSLFQS